MRMYRKFGQGVAILCCVAMFVLAIVFFISHGTADAAGKTEGLFKFALSSVDQETGEVVRFYEYIDFQAALLVALAFLVSTVANGCSPDFPQIATGISLLPLVLTFYEMAVGNLNFVAAAIVLLMALIHFASNALEWYDNYQLKKQEQVENEAAQKEENAVEQA